MASCLKLTLLLVVAPVLLLMFAPGIPPHDMEFEAENVTTVPFEGPLAANNRLDEGLEFLPMAVGEGTNFGRVKGPEAFAFKDDYVYTGVHGGDVLRYHLKQEGAPSAGEWEYVVRTGFPCSHQHEEKICGRPAGMQFDRHGDLYVADTHYGIYRVDVKVGLRKTVVKADEVVDGRANKMFNSVAVAVGGDLYYSVSSTRFGLHESMLELMSISSPNGRVLKRDVSTGKTEVILDDLVFANGIVLSPREDFLLVNDLGRNRIMKVWLKGPSKGKSEVFAHTPGANDNITPNGNSGYLVGIVAPRQPDKFNPIYDVLLPYKYARRVVTRIMYNVKALFEFLHDAFPNPYFARVAYWVANTELATSVVPGYGLVVEYDQDGKVLQSWHSPEGKMSFVCEGKLHGGWMYLGSPYEMGVKRIKYTKAK